MGFWLVNMQVLEEESIPLHSIYPCSKDTWVMATHLHIQIPELYHRNDTMILWFSDTQARESTTEEMNRIIRKLSEYLNWASPWAAAVVNSLWYKGLCLDCRAFLFPFKLRLPRATLESVKYLWEQQQGEEMRSKKRNHISPWRTCPLHEASAAVPQRAASCQLLPACPARLPAQLPCRNSPRGKTQGKHRHGLVLHKPFSSFRNQREATGYFDLWLYSTHSLLCHPFPPGKAHGLSARSRQLWFLGSQPLHHRTHECSEGVSSLSRPLCHPDINANGKNWATAWTYSSCMCILPPHCHLVNTPSIDQFINQEN